MSLAVNDTIVALATPPFPASRGIVRISGPRTVDLVAGCVVEPLERPRRAGCFPVTWRCRPPVGDVPLVLYLWPDARSYTAEPAAELHAVGALPVLDALVERCLDSGARLARPGEYTLRAFLAGRIDLTQAEAVLGVIDAEDESSLNAALGQLAGGIGHPLRQLRCDLVDTLAHLEAGLDFVEEPIDFLNAGDLANRCDRALRTVDQLLEQIERRGRTESVLRVGVVGKPNVGKSSLVNALAGREAALVANQAGTTRDPVTTRVDWNGRPIELIDAPGEEDGAAEESVDAAACRLARELLQRADLRLWCIPADAQLGAHSPGMDATGSDLRTLVVRTCADRCARPWPSGQRWVSSRTGEGIAELRREIGDILGRSVRPPMAGLGVRCRSGLVEAREFLRRAVDLARERRGEELVAMELRGAMDRLGELVGELYTDELLDEIFGRFCIGK